MAVFAALLVLSRHFPPGEMRSGLQRNAAYVLIPSLLPLASALHGVRVDYAAHFGGAIGGAAVAFVVLLPLSQTEPRPRLKPAALAVAIAGCAGSLYAAVPVPTNHVFYEFAPALAPPSQFTDLDTITLERATALAEYFPRDPRMRFMRARHLIDAGDLFEAEKELRAALAEEAVWTRVFPGDLNYRIRAVLALVLIELQLSDQAREVARPVCASAATGTARKLLDLGKLCGT